MRRAKVGQVEARAAALVLADPDLAARVLVLAEGGAALPSVVRSPRDCEAIARPMLDALPHEALCVVALDTRHRVIGRSVVSRGSDRATVVDVRAILRWALTVAARPAAALVLAHNHPSGDPEPSADDYGVTRSVRAGCDAVGIRLVDHVVIGDGDRFVSLAERGSL